MKIKILGLSFVLFAITVMLPSSVVRAQSSVDWSCAETLLTIPQNSFVKSAETDGFSASITYTTPTEAEKLLVLPLHYAHQYVFGLHVYGDAWTGPYHELGPFVYIPSGSLVLKDGTYYMKSTTSSRIKNLKGTWVNEFTAVRLSCTYSPGSSVSYNNWGTQWQIKANASGTPPETSTSSQQPVQSKELEGIVDTFGASSIVLNKGGTFLQLTITSQTVMTLNGQHASPDSLLVGDKAKALYDPNTNEALELRVER